jgi:hypothetical protein
MILPADQHAKSFAELLEEHFYLFRAGRQIQSFENSKVRDHFVRTLVSRDKGRVLDKRKLTQADLRKKNKSRVSEVQALLAKTKVNKISFCRQLSAMLENDARDEEQAKALLNILNDRRAAIEEMAETIPSSIEKARQYLYHGAIHFHDIHAINASASVLSDDNDGVSELLAQLRDDDVPSSQLGLEDIDNSAWYTFSSQFGNGEINAHKKKQQIEINFRRSLQELSISIEEANHEVHRVEAFLPAQLIWNITRSAELSRKLHPESTKLASLIATLQDADGAWRQPKWADRDLTCETTAFCLLALTRAASRSHSASQIERASNWLCGVQASHGGWSAEGNPPSTKSPDLLTTTIARQAIAMSTPNAHRHVSRASAFIMSHQGPLGCWETRPYWPSFSTAITIDSLEAVWCEVSPELSNDYLRMARDLLPKAHFLLLSDDPADLRLGVIGIYHGLESFLYGCFSHLDISFWKHGQTIGLRDSLTAFRDWRREHDLGTTLRYEQQIRHLASLRDNLVHRSAAVNKESAVEVNRDVMKFITTHADELLPSGIPLASVWPGLNA